MTYFQVQTDIDDWPFDFTEFFPSSTTIASTVVLCDPAGLVELSAKSSTSGLKRTIVIDAASATVDTEYILGCQCTSASGLRHTLYKTIRVIEDETGATAIAGTTGAHYYYSAILSQSGTSNPTVEVLTTNLPETITWTRYSQGTYHGTVVGNLFLANKTKVNAHLGQPLYIGNESDAHGYRALNTIIVAEVRDFGDNLVDGYSLLYVDIQTYT